MTSETRHSDLPGDIDDEKVAITAPFPAEPPASFQSDLPRAPLKRLLSLDALRGFDMFWIVGGTAFFNAVADQIGPGSFHTLVREQTTHVGWDGFRFYDLIFPLFVFLSGVTMPLSLRRRLEQGTPRLALYWRVLRRSLLLVFLGIAIGLFRLEPERLRAVSVLGLIGCAYFIAAMVVLHRGVRGQLIWAAGILVGYHLALLLIPTPGIGSGVFTPGGHLGGYIDQQLLPGKLYQGVFDPEGLLNIFPAAAIALLGAGAGHLLVLAGGTQASKVRTLILCGLASLALGYVWSFWFPVIKAMWSSSYILVAAGWSFLLLALFYLVIDVLGLRFLAFPFVPIGMNAITIYVLRGYIDFRYPAERIFGGAARLLGEAGEPSPVVLAAGLLAVEWVLLYFLYRKKIFLRA